MIKKVYYSSLNDEIYATKEEAQTAEDLFVQEYFKDLERVAEMKRRVKRSYVFNKPRKFNMN